MTEASFKKLLQKIKADEFREFILHHAIQDPDFETEVRVYFASKDAGIDQVKKYRSLVESIIEKNSDRGYINYRSANVVSSEIDSLTENGYLFAHKGDFRGAFMVAKALLLPTTEIIQECDDSSGSIGGSISYIISLIISVAEEDLVSDGVHEELFQFLKNELRNSLYFDYGDFGYDLFSIFHSLAIRLGKTEEYPLFLGELISHQKGSFYEYRVAHFKTMLIDFFQQVGQHDKADRLISENMDIVEVRKAELEKLLAQKEYKLAKNLIEEGIRIAKAKENYGTVKDWQKDLLHIATLERDTTSVRQVSKDLAFDRGLNRTYYLQWKSTYSSEEWKPVIEEFIAERTAQVLAEQNRMSRNLWSTNDVLLMELGPIYIEESMWDRLLTLVQNARSLRSVLEYHPYLYGHFPDAMMDMYIPLFLKKGEQANDRSAYAELARLMKKIMKDIPSGSARIKVVAHQLREKFPRRPAMLDELSKL